MPRRILTDGDSIDNYREVTAAERVAIEAEDAKWVLPPQLFIDMWDIACGKYGRYNRATGYFELNGLTDITYEQAIAIYQAWRPKNAAETASIYARMNIRTNIPWVQSINSGCGEAFFASSIEVARLSEPFTTITGLYCFYACSKLHTIIGDIRFGLNNEFKQCSKLVSVTARMNVSGGQLSFIGSPLLSLDSIRYSIEKSQPCTILLHPDAYARVTDELFTLAEERNITLAAA